MNLSRCRWSVDGKFHGGVVEPGRTVLPLSSLLSRPLVSIELHCLPSSSCAAKAMSHPSGVGVRPHLPTSEFVCVDELWTYSAGMFFCGDYKGPYSHWEASTELSHSNFFVSQRLSGGGSLLSKHPQTVNLPIPADPLASEQSQTKKLWIQTWGFLLVDLEYVFLTLVQSVYFFFFFFFWVILLRIHIFLSPREVQNRGSGEWGGGSRHVVVFKAKSWFSLMCFETEGAVQATVPAPSS